MQTRLSSNRDRVDGSSGRFLGCILAPEGNASSFVAKTGDDKAPEAPEQNKTSLSKSLYLLLAVA